MFVRNCWYVAGWSHDVAPEKIFPARLLGEPIAIYRNDEGTLRVVADRCPHRFAPLSLGCVEGDGIRCRYHGLKFNAEGQCDEIPGGGPLDAIQPLRHYPVAEQDSWIWVWMGDHEKADTALIPRAFGIDNPAFHMRADHFDYKANYMLLNDNLCDLSHVDFVHEKTLGLATGGGWSTLPVDIKPVERGLSFKRWFVGQPMSPTNPKLVDTWNSYFYYVPGIFVMESKSYPHGTAERVEMGEPNEEPITYRIEQQAVSPVSETDTRYFYATGFDARMPEKLLDGIFGMVMAAFAEDKEVIEAQQLVLHETPADQKMSYIPHDRGVTMFRRMMERMMREEQA